MSPCGCKAWLQFETLFVEGARPHQPVIRSRKLVRPKIELVCTGIVRRVRGWRSCADQGKRKSLDDAAGDVVLQMKEITERGLHGVRCQQRAAWSFDELHGGPQLIACAQQCS